MGGITYAFSNCWNLTHIDIPQGLTEIGEGAFQGCSALTQIILPQGITKVGMYAFSDCCNLTHITFPQGLTEIGKAAFQGCSNLKRIIIKANDITPTYKLLPQHLQLLAKTTYVSWMLYTKEAMINNLYMPELNKGCSNIIIEKLSAVSRVKIGFFKEETKITNLLTEDKSNDKLLVC